ncbi:hypothetical protein PYW07_005675 [Mythimna separata]|uniref:Carboxylesterase type B domain-containing protein n=1 Tax=Mythimna separata TaxID=271217 RepID=A0AAD7YJT1_MYTSE|nr:hypothetical protein PYW07_005675 [Mythimna separata]
MGIPYAAPPVGDLRFMPPQPVNPWDEPLTTTKEKPACIQYNNNIKKGQPYGMYGVEDCLYLDIFTPAIDENERAVIVLIVTDHFQNSYNKSKDYAPDFFIEEDVVVVTISHRLAAIGFLSLENELLPGNSGLKDIVEALEWVRDNVGQFGGDLNRITLMGLQGGAAAIDLLMYSKAKDLFSAAILHSGTSWSTAYLQEDVRKRAFRLGEIMEVPSSSDIKLLKDLQGIPADKLLSRDLHASPDDYFKETQRSVIAFSPIVEKQPDGLITEYPEDSTERINIPIMMGSNSREGMNEDGTWGAATGDEMCYLFKCPDLVKEYLKLENNVPEEKIVQKKMIKMWTNFAKCGNPTPENDEDLEGLQWPPYTVENKEYLHIDKHMKINKDLYKRRFNFWDQFIEKWERLAVDGVVTESKNKKDEL